jgi:riboflavin synthase alpha subunit
VALIPTTLERTNLRVLKVGDAVNLETDILARTVVHALGLQSREPGLTEARLREQGF